MIGSKVTATAILLAFFINDFFTASFQPLTDILGQHDELQKYL